MLIIRQGATLKPDDLYLHLHTPFGVDTDGNPTAEVTKGDPQGTYK